MNVTIVWADYDCISAQKIGFMAIVKTAIVTVGCRCGFSDK